ncbi:Eukaryotic peptide chain release factor GTP-binding subunit [Basidiobolus ranarum]|uniref:Palmitoyltransferase n=1 Tax=Basidiobolus ranarum TaxID=34480 RepID=A0ABR2W2P9_9FUNG
MKPSSNPSRPRYVYESFAGKNKVFLWGTIVTGSDFWAFGVTLVLIHIPVILFSIFVCPFVYNNISPAVVFVFAYIYLLCLFSLLKTSWTDPGILPRNLDPVEPMDTFGEPSGSSDMVDQSYFPLSAYPGLKDVVINGVALKLKYCDTCQLYRPPRCSHCRQCDNCVENEDHHCIWVNNCVGRRNYRYFFTFILTTSLLSLYVFGFSLGHLILYWKKKMRESTSGMYSFQKILGEAPISLVLVIYAFIFGFALTALTIYHLCLISKNMTTHEQIRSSVNIRHVPHPFNLGNFVKNIIQFIARPRPASYIEWRKLLEEERQSNKRQSITRVTPAPCIKTMSSRDHNPL